MELTFLEMYRTMILHSFPFSKPKIYHAKCILIVKWKQITELMLQKYIVRRSYNSMVWNNKF
jgi:hypothetical protein